MPDVNPSSRNDGDDDDGRRKSTKRHSKSRRGSKRSHHHHRRSSNNNKSDRLSGGGLAATKLMDEVIEAARQQGIEEGRSERDIEHGEPPVSNNNKSNTGRKYAFAAFVVVVIAASIVVWQVMTDGNKDDPPQVGPTSSSLLFIPPTQDDCSAVSEGLAVVGQNSSSVRTFAVDMKIAVPLNNKTSLEFLKTELEVRTQRYVLPLLLGCPTNDETIINDIQNNMFVIENALLQQLEFGSPKACDSDPQSSSSTLCLLANLEIPLFLKDLDAASRDYFLDLIGFVFRHEGLLEVLDLTTPVKAIEIEQVYEVLATAPLVAPSFLPSSSPSLTVPDGDLLLPSLETCLNISNGNGGGDEGQGVLQEYNVYMDVTLTLPLEDLMEITRELQE